MTLLNLPALPTLRRMLGLTLAALLSVTSVVGAADIATARVTPRTGNDGAWVQGLGQCDIGSHRDCWAWIDPVAGTACPDGHFCVYTAKVASEGGKVFSFYHCTHSGRDWALHGWSGVGYFHNSDSGGAHAYLKDANHRVLLDAGPGASGPYDYTSVWFVRAC
jgi:hypothetical protein